MTTDVLHGDCMAILPILAEYHFAYSYDGKYWSMYDASERRESETAARRHAERLARERGQFVVAFRVISDTAILAVPGAGERQPRPDLPPDTPLFEENDE